MRPSGGFPGAVFSGRVLPTLWIPPFRTAMARAVVLQHVPFEGPARLEPLLRERGYETHVVPVYDGVALPAPRDADLLVVMGGPMSVNDTDTLAWLEPEMRAVREAIEAGTPTLGICLGAQLIAACLGAAVRPHETREIGWFGVHAVRDEPLAAALSAPPRVMHWHGERWELPTGARLLVSSLACDHQAFAIGDHVLGLQYHLEMDRPAVQALIDNCPEDLAPGAHVDTPAEILDTKQCFEPCHAAMAQAFDVWVEGWTA